MRVAGQGDGGMAIHVLGDIAGQEVELVPDPFKWALDQFKSGKLPAMLTRAGYPTVAAALDEGLVAEKLVEVEARAQAMLA
jgi:hypothetical protein